jgi:hypothetical protein
MANKKKNRYAGIGSLLPAKEVDLHISNDQKDQVISKAIFELEKLSGGLAMGPKASLDVRSRNAEKLREQWRLWATEDFKSNPRYGYKQVAPLVKQRADAAGHKKVNGKPYSERTIREAITGCKPKNK